MTETARAGDQVVMQKRQAQRGNRESHKTCLPSPSAHTQTHAQTITTATRAHP